MRLESIVSKPGFGAQVKIVTVRRNDVAAVERLLADLEAGTARPLERPGARDGYYTYPGLTDYVRQRRRLLASSPA
jgi:hypothetical protein